MGSASFSFGDGEWFPLFGPKIDDESPVERAQRLAHLREAKARNAERFRCPRCGTPDAKWAHETYPEICKPIPKCSGCGAEFRYQVPESCPLCGTPVYIKGKEGQ